jgi:hypothetical protein
LRPSGIARDETGDDDIALRMRDAPRSEALAGFVPVDRDAELARMHHQHLARVQACPARGFTAERGLHQPRRPHFAHALDLRELVRLQRGARGDGVEQFGKRGEFAVQPADQAVLRVGIEAQRLAEMAVAQLRPGVLPFAAVAGDARQRGQGIGDALHRGDDDRARRGRILHQRGDMPEALRIGDAAAAELVRATGGKRRLGGIAIHRVRRGGLWVERIHVKLLVGAPCRESAGALPPRPCSGAGRKGKVLHRFAVAARTAGGTGTGEGHGGGNDGAARDDGSARGAEGDVGGGGRVRHGDKV